MSKLRYLMTVGLVWIFPSLVEAQIGPIVSPSGGSSSSGGITAGAAATGCSIYSLVYVDSGGNLACAKAPINGATSTAATAITQINETISGSSATSNWLNITGTFPATLSAVNSGIYFSVTADNDDIEQDTFRSVFTPGASVNSSGTHAIHAVLSSGNVGNYSAIAVAGESLNGTNLLSSDNAQTWTFGTQKFLRSAAGLSGWGNASVGTSGVDGVGITSGSGYVAVGGKFFGNNSNAGARSAGVMAAGTGTGTYVGGWFQLSSGALAFPATSTALLADNGAVAADIFSARDNGSAVFTIADGGTFTQVGSGNNVIGSGGGSLSIGGGGGSVRMDDGAAGLRIYNGYPLAFAPTSASTAANAFIRSSGAATFQLGTDVNGAPVAQTLTAHNGITGTDVIGANLTLGSGVGTGAGNGAQINLNRANARATGTTGQSSTNGFVVCESKILSNTSSTTTTLATIGLASNTGGGASVSISIVADDGTNFDAETQSANLSFVNKAGAFTVSTPTITASSAANNSGSATIGFTATGASSLISLKVTPVFTTIVPTTVRAYIEINNHSAGAVTCQ